VGKYNTAVRGKIMSNRIEWIIYKDKEILSVDFSGLHDKEFVEKIIELRNFIVDSGRENIHGLLNVSNVYVYGNVFKEAKKTARIVNTQIEKVAMVGSTKVQEFFIKILRNIMRIKFEAFDSIEDAKSWLVES
jgi:2',3'-cyclic-nucleotide 2'-phosphodiesterase (5'-nucleotidase family)